MLKNFCTNLINYRQKAQLSRHDVAEKLGITEIAYGAYERGKRLPDIEKLCALSDLFETTPNNLIGYKQDEFIKAKKIWSIFKFKISENEDNSITLSFEYPIDLNEKITLKDGKIDFENLVNHKSIDFLDKKSFVSYTSNLIKGVRAFKNWVDETALESSSMNKINDTLHKAFKSLTEKEEIPF